MGVAWSIIAIGAGAILKWAVTASVAGIDLQVVGVILMVLGVVGLVISLALMFMPDRNQPPPPSAPNPPY